VRKAVRQSIDEASRQANPEVATDNIRVMQYARNFIQTSPRDFGIHMDKPKNFAVRSTRPRIHLYGPTRCALNKLIAKGRGESSCAIGASAVRDDNLGFGRSLAQMREKSPYQLRLVEHRNNDRELHLSSSLQVALNQGRESSVHLTLSKIFGLDEIKRCCHASCKQIEILTALVFLALARENSIEHPITYNKTKLRTEEFI
jgi:hypothetical protein